MNVVDSSGWIEYLKDGSNADDFLPVIRNYDELIVPVITIYELFRYVLTHGSEQQALQVAAQMQRGRVIDLNSSLSIEAALLSRKHKLPMADSLILATAIQFKATLWTQDSDFEGIEGVRYIPESNHTI